MQAICGTPFVATTREVLFMYCDCLPNMAIITMTKSESNLSSEYLSKGRFISNKLSIRNITIKLF